MELNKFFFIKKAIADYIKKNDSDKTITAVRFYNIIAEAEKEFNDAQKNLDEIIEYSN